MVYVYSTMCSGLVNMISEQSCTALGRVVVCLYFRNDPAGVSFSSQMSDRGTAVLALDDGGGPRCIGPTIRPSLCLHLRFLFVPALELSAESGLHHPEGRGRHPSR